MGKRSFAFQHLQVLGGCQNGVWRQRMQMVLSMSSPKRIKRKIWADINSLSLFYTYKHLYKILLRRKRPVLALQYYRKPWSQELLSIAASQSSWIDKLKRFNCCFLPLFENEARCNKYVSPVWKWTWEHNSFSRFFYTRTKGNKKNSGIGLCNGRKAIQASTETSFPPLKSFTVILH